LQLVSGVDASTELCLNAPGLANLVANDPLPQRDRDETELQRVSNKSRGN
jgi:hypothetical protein